MRKFLNLALVSALVIGGGSAGWGGRMPTVAHYGWDTGPFAGSVPATMDRFYYYIYGTVLDPQWDQINLAIASIDAEIDKIRIQYDETGLEVDEQDEVIVAVNVHAITESVPSACSDAESAHTPCTLAGTSCQSWTVTGGKKLCDEYKIDFYWNRIVANKAAPGHELDPVAEDSIYPVMRHEFTHVLGFDHGAGGPMSAGASPLTACQIDILNFYNSQPTWSTWTYGVPSDCL